MDYTHKNAIKAVLTAFIFSVLTYLLLTGSPSPMETLVGFGDLIVEARRPMEFETRLLGSDLHKAVAGIPEAKSAIDGWKSHRDRFDEILGPLFDWIGWGPWRVAAVFDGDRAPLLAVGAGYLAPLGKYLAESAGFEKIDDIGGFEALGRQEFVFVRHDEIWLIGNDSTVAEALKRLDAEPPAWWRLSWNLTRKGDVSLLISNNALRTLVGSKDAKVDNGATFKEWLDMPENGATPVALEVDGGEISGRAWLPMDENAPLPRLWDELGDGRENVDFIHHDTILAARLAIENPTVLWKRTEELYSKRPIASRFLMGAEQELERELGVAIDDVLKNIHDEIGFVKFRGDHRSRTLIFTEAGPGWESSLRDLESNIAGPWQSGFEGLAVRFMPRLLTYGVVGDRLMIASRPKVLGTYVESMKKPSPLVGEMRGMAKRLANKPLLIAGRLGAEPNGDASFRDLAGWYAAGVDYIGGVFIADFTIPVRLGDVADIPLNPRLLRWGLTLLHVGGWMLAALVLGSFFAHALSVNRKKHGIEER